MTDGSARPEPHAQGMRIAYGQGSWFEGSLRVVENQAHHEQAVLANVRARIHTSMNAYNNRSANSLTCGSRYQRHETVEDKSFETGFHG